MDSTEIKGLLEKQAKAVEELRSAHDNNEQISQGKLDKIKEDFLAGEEANKVLQAKLDEQENKLQEQEEKINILDKQFNRLPGGENIEENLEIKAFDKYMKEFPKKEKMFSLDEMESKYLRTDLAANGGVLVPETLFNELIKKEIEISPIQENSRIINSKVKSMTIAIRTTIPSSNRPGEGGTSTKSHSNYKSVRLEAYRNDAIIPITREELNFAAFNMRDEMGKDAALALTQQTNVDFIEGDGINKSEGILTNADVGILNSGIANDIKMDNFYEIQKKDNIKTVYRRTGKFYMNSNTLFDLLQAKTGDGQYLWTASIALGLPPSLAGRPYVETPDMPDTGTNEFPVFFGDLRRAYYILRAIEMELIIDPYSNKEQAIIDYMWIEYLGGKVVLPEAIVKLKCAV